MRFKQRLNDLVMDSYKFITYNGAKTLHINDSYGIKEGLSANFIVLDAENYYEALIKDAAVLYSYRKGRKIVENTPSKKQLLV